MKEYKAGFEKGRKRTVLKSYARMGDKRHRLVEKISKAQSQELRQTLITELKEFDKIYHSMPRSDAVDASFRRLQYTRYADDFLIGIIGSKADAEKIKQDIGKYLAEKLKAVHNQPYLSCALPKI